MAEHSPVVRFGRLESRGVLLGLSMPQLALVGVGVLILVVAQYAGGTAAAVLAAPVWALPLVVALVPWRGRPLLMWIPVLGGWVDEARVWIDDSAHAARERGGRACRPGDQAPEPGGELVRCRSRARRRRFLGDHGAPGRWDLAAAGRRRRTEGPGGWLGFDAGLDGADVRPAARAGAAPQRARRVNRLAGVVDGAVGRRTMGIGRHRPAVDVPGRHPASGDAHRRPVEVQESRCGARGIADGIDRQTDALVQGLRSAGVRVIGWAGEAELARLLRRSFEPGSSGANAGSEPSAKPPVAGMALQESWDHVRTDSAVHAVYWVREWPRSDAHVSFLHPLLNGSGRRTLSLTIEPVPLGRAMRDIRRAKVEHAADEARNARWGRVGVEAERAESEDVVRRERELVAGHADLRFVGLLTVSADDLDALAAACAATETAAAQAMCEIRRLAGQQSAAWLAGALPLARSVS